MTKQTKTKTIRVDYSGASYVLYQRPPTGRKVACEGFAHTNPEIDHCSLCAPSWGLVEEKAPLLTIEEVKDLVRRGYAVAVGDTAYDCDSEEFCSLCMRWVYQGGASFYAYLEPHAASSKTQVCKVDTQ